MGKALNRGVSVYRFVAAGIDGLQYRLRVSKAGHYKTSSCLSQFVGRIVTGGNRNGEGVEFEATFDIA